MILIQHRVNSLSELQKIPQDYGIEIDVRYHNDNLILHHDPLNHHINTPIELEALLQNWNSNSPIILNIKTEGIEQLCIEIMNKFKIKNWFFLDLSMPYMVKYSLEAENKSTIGFSPENLAVRFSEYEPIEYALSFQGRVNWIWVDCFHSLPMTPLIYSKIKNANFKICLVSPELQNHKIETIKDFKSQILEMKIDAICTKRPDLWKA